MSARQSTHELQAAILDAVGPSNWRDLGITAATLTLTARSLPRLTIDIEHFPEGFKGTPTQLRRLFELQPIDAPCALPAEPPALDLDQMAADARQRIAVDVNNLALDASVQIECAFINARERTHRRHDQLQTRFELSQLRWRIEHPGPMTWFYGGPAQVLVEKLEAKLARQRGQILTPLAGAIAIALALGVLGPALDAQPDHSGEWLQAEQELQQSGALARWEAEAREHCARLGGENTAYVRVDGGGIVCKSKRGHVLAQRGRP
jgi:hypothetical protein